MEHDITGLSDEAAAEVLTAVRAAVMRATSASLEALAASLAEPIRSICLRAWPLDFPEDIALLRRPPYQSRADSVMYCQALAECAQDRGWEVHVFQANSVVAQAAQLLGPGADEILSGPRKALGPPWTKDHRMALAATILAA